MAAAERTCFHEYYTQEASLFPGLGLLHEYRADPAITLASLLNDAEAGLGYPLPLLLATDSHLPEVVLMPFSYGLPGMAN